MVINMNPIFDNVLFYGGIAFAACVVIAAMIYLCVYKSGVKRLMLKLEAEYGKKERKPSSKHSSSAAARKRGI